MSEVIAFFGQSNYDLTLEVYGDLNFFISFLNQNNISKSTDLKSNYSFSNDTKTNSNNFINKSISGETYATLSPLQPEKLNPLLNNDDVVLLNNDGESLFNNF